MSEVHEHAEALRDFYKENPEGTIDEAVEVLDIEDFGHQDVAEILNSHFVDEDGNIENLGFGQGGGWVLLPNQELVGTDIGYRWPDRQLREEPFDPENPEHRKLAGLPDLPDPNEL